MNMKVKTLLDNGPPWMLVLQASKWMRSWKLHIHVTHEKVINKTIRQGWNAPMSLVSVAEHNLPIGGKAPRLAISLHRKIRAGPCHH